MTNQRKIVDHPSASVKGYAPCEGPPPTSPRVLLLRAGMVLLFAVLIVGGALKLSDAARHAADRVRLQVATLEAGDGLLELRPDWISARIDVASRYERDVILSMVRNHRLSTDDAWRQQLADAIYYESLIAGVDPLLITSIIAKESSFKSRTVSRAGAVGLMQLRPWVAKDLAGRRDLEWEGLQTLHSPRLNVRLGIQYYKELIDLYNGDPRKALTAYNYGPTRVNRQIRKGTYSGSEYARRIIQLYESLSSKRELVAPSDAGAASS